MSCFSCCLSDDKINKRSLRKSIHDGKDARTIASSFANLSFKSGILALDMLLILYDVDHILSFQSVLCAYDRLGISIPNYWFTRSINKHVNIFDNIVLKSQEEWNL